MRFRVAIKTVKAVTGERLGRNREIKGYTNSVRYNLVYEGCLKKILNNLRLPLFNYKIYSMIIEFPGGDEMQFIRTVIK